jgi:hypothetical protein
VSKAPFNRRDLADLIEQRASVPGAADAALVGVSRVGFATDGLDKTYGPADLVEAWRIANQSVTRSSDLTQLEPLGPSCAPRSEWGRHADSATASPASLPETDGPGRWTRDQKSLCLRSGPGWVGRRRLCVSYAGTHAGRADGRVNLLHS